MESGDSDIVRKVLAGEKNAYAELVRRYQSGLHRLCSVRLGNRAQAEEAAQEVFLKAYHSLSSFRQDASFRTWIYRIAVNYCTDLERREKWKPWMFWKPQENQSPAPLARRENPPADLSESIEAALRQLPGDYREILVLRELQGFRYDELAQTLGCSLDSVKARLQRARKALAVKLKEDE